MPSIQPQRRLGDRTSNAGDNYANCRHVGDEPEVYVANVERCGNVLGIVPTRPACARNHRRAADENTVHKFTQATCML